MCYTTIVMGHPRRQLELAALGGIGSPGRNQPTHKSEPVPSRPGAATIREGGKVTEKQKFRWLKQNRHLLTQGQNRCLSNISKAWGQRVHSWHHYGPQVVALHRKVVNTVCVVAQARAPFQLGAQ